MYHYIPNCIPLRLNHQCRNCYLICGIEIWIYMYMQTYTHTCMHTFIHTYIAKCTYAYILMHIHTYSIHTQTCSYLIIHSYPSYKAHQKDGKIIKLLSEYHKSRKNRILVFVLYKMEATRVQSHLASKGKWTWKQITNVEKKIEPHVPIHIERSRMSMIQYRMCCIWFIFLSLYAQ